MKKKIIIYLIIILISAIISLIINLSFPKSKIGFVNSTELVYGYVGMQEAHQQFQIKQQQWQLNIDSLKNDFNNAIKNYESVKLKLSKEERAKQENILYLQQQHLEKYSVEINQFSKQEDDKLTQGVLNQINTFVQEYGKKNGYTLILGTTNQGSLIYGQDNIDLTKQILKELNEKY